MTVKQQLFENVSIIILLSIIKKNEDFSIAM